MSHTNPKSSSEYGLCAWAISRWATYRALRWHRPASTAGPVGGKPIPIALAKTETRLSRDLGQPELGDHVARGGIRKTMTVALARKLLIALWRLVTTGEAQRVSSCIRRCEFPVQR